MKQRTQGMSRPGFAMQILLLFLLTSKASSKASAKDFLTDMIDSVTSGLQTDILGEETPTVTVENKDVVIAPSSGMSLALNQKSVMTATKQGGHNAASLENMAMGMAAMSHVLAGSPEMAEAMHSIEKIVNETIADVYENYWHHVGLEPMLYPRWQNNTEKCNNASTIGSLPVMSEKHVDCRKEQSELQTTLDTSTICSVEYQQTMAALRQQECDYFWTTVNVFPRTHFPDGCKRKIDEADQHWTSRVNGDFYTRQQYWNISYVKCQTVLDKFENETQYCSNLTKALAILTAECDGLQSQLDAASCNVIMGEDDSAEVLCKDYDLCWSFANESYITENASIAKTEADAAGEIKALKRVRCLCRALLLPENQTEDALQVCASSTFDTHDCFPKPDNSSEIVCSDLGPPIAWSHYLVDWNPSNTPTLPKKPNCTNNVQGLKPCTQPYVETHFSHLPANAPAAPSTVACCTMCNFFEGCGPGLMRPYADLVSGFDEETCCLEVKWIIGTWSPSHHGESCPIGCGHSAQYFSRVISCQDQLGLATQESNCVDQSGPKPASGLACSATELCISCDPCDWEHERVGCDPFAVPAQYGKCVQCQKFLGHYFVEKGSCEQKQCQPCNNTGQYLKDCENSHGNPGVCVDCTPTENHYFTEPGSFVDFSCTTKKCATCAIGEFSASCAGTFEGTCEKCISADNSGIPGYQQYYLGPGAVANDPYSCPTRLCDYSSCQFGSYLVNCGGANYGTCLPCQPQCSYFADQASCPPSCHWNTDMSICEATTYVISSSGGTCRFAPCEAKVCGEGNYLAGCGGILNGTCRPCYVVQAGRFFAGSGRYAPDCPSEVCQNCSAGFYRKDCSGTHGGQCVSCTTPPSGNYFSGHGGLSDNCPHQPCDGEVCTDGHYLYQCGGGLQGTCKACTQLAGEHYFSSNGGFADSCTQTTCDVNVCTMGYYLKNCGGHMSPAHNGSCTKCSAPPEGYYHNSNGGTTNSCTSSACSDLPECPTGQYQKGCGGSENPVSQGACDWCLNVQPGVVYLASSGDLTGTCEERSCDTLPNCDDGLMRGGCGIASDPTSEGSCNASCGNPGDGWYYFEGCVAKPCDGCGAGQFRDGCGTDELFVNSGVCTSCPVPEPGLFYDLTIASACNPQNCSSLPGCGTGNYRKSCADRYAGQCEQCDAPPNGYYATGEGTLTSNSCALSSCNELDPCAAGQYRKDCGVSSNRQSIGTCATCDPPPSGWFYNAPSDDANNATSCPMRSCLLESGCPPGFFRGGCGEDETVNYATIGTCQKCSAPPDGYYYVSDGGITDDCTKLSCASTPQCETGYWRYDCGGPETPTTYGSCIPCTSPTAGRFFTGHGYQNDSCPTEACSTAGECNAGQYRTNCGGQNNPTSDGFCKQCSAPLLPGNMWLTDGDFFDDCVQGPPPTTTTTTWR